MSNKTRLVGISISLILILYASMRGGKFLSNFVLLWLIVISIKDLITILGAEIKAKKQIK